MWEREGWAKKGVGGGRMDGKGINRHIWKQQGRSSQKSHEDQNGLGFKLNNKTTFDLE